MLDHLRRISFVFFFLLGLVHFISGLVHAAGHFTQISGVINRVSFIPFVISALILCFSNFKHALIEYGTDAKTWDYAFIAVGVVVFLGLLGIEFFVHDL